MIGNDVVDLKLANVESNWRRKGYLQKIFTPFEIEIISKSSDPEKTVWTLWTCKESAYKIVNRKTGERSFNPQKFECFQTDNSKFNVIYDKLIYYCRTEISEGMIYTEAIDDENQFYNIELVSNDYNISKMNNVPFCSISNRPMSVTHHGRYRFAIILNQINLIPSLDLSFKNDNASK